MSSLTGMARAILRPRPRRKQRRRDNRHKKTSAAPECSGAFRFLKSQPWRRGFVRFGPGVRVGNVEFAFENLVAARRKNRVELCAAETQIGDASVRCGNDTLHAAGLVADLDAEARGDVKASVAVAAHSARAAVVVPVALVQPVITLLVGERAVGLDDVAINPVRAIVDRKS